MVKVGKDKLDWELRVSRRARYARLQIKPYGGLEVVIPPRFPRDEIAALVDRHAGWISRQLDQQAKLRASIRLPQEIALDFDNSLTRIVYADEPMTRDLFVQQYLHIDADTYQDRIYALRNWIRQRAWDSFPAMLDEVASQIGLRYRKLTIRSQKTRWGSCSRQGNISLNDQLLFVPAETVRYLMIHELCHTRHLNHSRRFWNLVASHCPDYRAHEKLLGRPRGLVPDWFLRDLYD